MMPNKFSGIQGFSERLEKAIRDSGKTFGQVCRETGISRSQLYNLKMGQQGPSAIHVAKLSACLGCSADWLLGLKIIF